MDVRLRQGGNGTYTIKYDAKNLGQFGKTMAVTTKSGTLLQTITLRGTIIEMSGYGYRGNFIAEITKTIIENPDVPIGYILKEGLRKSE